MASCEREVLSSFAETVGITLPDGARELCKRQQDMASRLYLFSYPELRACVTVFLGESSQVIIQDLGNGKAPFPAWLQERLGRSTITHARALSFVEKLASLGAWTKEECRTNSRDGLFAVLVMASTSAEHCIRMSNPDCHPDSSYMQMVNLYSEKFLGGAIRLVASRAPIPPKRKRQDGSPD